MVPYRLKPPTHHVTPAKAGIQGHLKDLLPWIPASAGMTNWS